MTWYAWVLVALPVLNALVTIARVGKPRDRLTSADAIAATIAAPLYVWAIVALATA